MNGDFSCPSVRAMAAAAAATTEREAARYEGTEILNPIAKDWRTVVTPRNLALTEENRGTFAEYETPYGVSALLRRTKDVRRLQRELLVAVDQPHLVRWIRAQNAFLETLGPRDMFVVKSYTRYGDILVNGWARGALAEDVGDLLTAAHMWSRIPFQYSLYDQYDAYAERGVEMPPRSEWLGADGGIREGLVAGIVRRNLDFFSKSANLGPLLRQFMADIVSVMRRSPRLIGDVVTYRGFKSEEHLKDLTYVSREFGSTSVNPGVALSFAGSTTVGLHKVYCCIYELTVRAGVPCLYLGSHTEFGDEYEILLPPGATYRLGREVLVKRVAAREPIRRILKGRIPTEEAMVVEGVVSWEEGRRRSSTRQRSREWTRESIESVEHVARRKKPGKGRRYKTVRRSSSERLERISEALTSPRSGGGKKSSE